MATDSDGDSEFSGFSAREVGETGDIPLRNEDDILDDDFSDIEISEIDSDEDFSEETADLDLLDIGGNWTKQLSHSVKFQFTGPTPGPTIQHAADAKELDFFELFFDDSCVNILVEQTNLCPAEATKQRP